MGLCMQPARRRSRSPAPEDRQEPPGRAAAARGWGGRDLRGQAERGRGDDRRRDRRRPDHHGARGPDQGHGGWRSWPPVGRRRGSGSSWTPGKAPRARRRPAPRPRDAARRERGPGPLRRLARGRTGAGRPYSRPRAARPRRRAGVRGQPPARARPGRAARALRSPPCSVSSLRWASCAAAGHPVDVVSTGGTGTAEFCAAHEVVTEVQPGSFMFMDADYSDTGGVPYRPSLTRDRDRDQPARPGPSGDRRRPEDAFERLWSRPSARRPGLVIRTCGRRARGADSHGRARAPRPSSRRPGRAPAFPHRHDRQPARRPLRAPSRQIEAAWLVAARGKVQ